MFTLRIANYQISEHYSKAVLESKYEHSLLSVPYDKISNMNDKTCFRIESD